MPNRPLEEHLAAFAEEQGFRGQKGPLCVALVVTQHAKEKGLPLDPAQLVTPRGGQVAGLGRSAVQSILGRHGIHRVLAAEGGRTSRGSLENMRKYSACLNELGADIDLERVGLHQKDLPGKPDLVFRGRRKAVFVHGCFWHGHGCPRGARRPKRSREYWTAKISRNRERDERNIQELVSVRWDVLVLWECQLRDSDRLRGLIKAFLDLDSTGRRVSDQSTAKATIDEATNAQDVALAEEVLERIRIGDEELIDAQEMWGPNQMSQSESNRAVRRRHIGTHRSTTSCDLQKPNVSRWKWSCPAFTDG